MKIKSFIAVAGFAALSSLNISAQESKNNLIPSSAQTKTAESFGGNSARQTSEVSRERRAQAYVKLLEGQRYIWLITSRRIRTEPAMAANVRLARQALQKAVELDPNLAEGYTALAFLSKNPANIEDAIMLAGIAVKIDPNNFGAHQILAQLYTVKSNLNADALDLNFAQKAATEWSEIARLDSRNAEAFAFLSEFYRKSGKKNERIAALKNWLSADAPYSDGFYGRVFQGESLAPQAATVKLGQALLEDRQTREAVEILSRAVADEPENTQAIELLSSAIGSADNNSVNAAVQSLQQAAFASPENPALVLLLAQVQSRTGKIEDAVKTLRDSSAKFAARDKVASSDLQVALADIYGDSNRVDEAAAIYQNALVTRGIDKNEVVTNRQRDFAMQVFEKIINLYKKANRPNDARATIERARVVLGEKDFFRDKN